MQLLFTDKNPALVGLVREVLENAGFDVLLKNEFNSVGLPPYNLWQEIWIMNDADYDRAMAAIEAFTSDGPASL